MSALISTTIRLTGPRPVTTAATAAATVARLHALLQQFLVAHHKCKSTGVDAIDSFTNELVDRKTTKWKSLKHKLAANQTTFNTIGQLTGSASAAPAHLAAIDDDAPAAHISLRITARRILQDLHGDTQTNVRHCLNVQTLSVQHIDQLLQSARLDVDQPAEFFVILDECLLWRKLPGDAVIVDCLHHLTSAEQSNVPAAVHYADQLIDLCAAEHPALYAEHAQFSHFRSRCRWHRGEHTQALQELVGTYAAMRHGQLVRMADALRSVLYEVTDCAIRRTNTHDADEEVLVAVERTAQQLSARFGENQMLMFLWRSCFESDLFRHQQRAVRMFDDCEEVRAFVGQKTSLMCYTLLQEHKVESVYRLIELLLKFGMRNDCRTCLSFLFDYQYWRRDLRACSEIMRSSLDMDAPLSEAHNQKLLNLLLGTAPAPRKKPAPRSTQPKFELQF